MPPPFGPPPHYPPHGDPPGGTPLPLPAFLDLFEQAPCALLLTDPHGKILYANRTSATWLGYPQHELAGGMCLQDLLSIGGGVLYQSHCQPLLQLQKAVADVQIDLVRRDGTRVPALLNATRHRVDGQSVDELAMFAAADRRAYERELQRMRAELLAAQAANEDLTAKLRAAIAALAAADRRGGQFLLGFCHDLRDPLAPMRGALELLRVTLPPEHAGSRLVAVLDRQMRQLAELVDDAAKTAAQRVQARPGAPGPDEETGR